MSAHLKMMFRAMELVSIGNFHPKILESLNPEILEAYKNIVKEGPQGIQIFILLHDIAKPDCLTLTYDNSRKVEVTWEEWCGMFDGEDLAKFCKQEGIKQISYFQEGRSHAKIGADLIGEYPEQSIPDWVKKTIELHEIGFLFGDRKGINIPLFDKNFGEWEKHHILLFMLCIYIDLMSSHNENGKPDIKPLLLLAESYEAWQKLTQLQERLESTERLNDKMVEKALISLRKAKDAFREEDVDQAYERIVEMARLPEVNEKQVREALAKAIEEGLSEELVKAIVADITSQGKLSRETGKQLGRFNKTVRPTLAKLGK